MSGFRVEHFLRRLLEQQIEIGGNDAKRRRSRIKPQQIAVQVGGFRDLPPAVFF